MGVAEHVAEISKYIKRTPDCVLVNTGVLPANLLEKYAEDHEYPVAFNYESDDCRIIPADMLGGEIVRTARGDVLKRSLIRHDPRKLARKIMDII